ncbi:DUF1150 family protein [Halovulum dunhuangense]|uniref:DUF1150 family protein n=1 Tax=Halovulum dunhuangense TaxID=1505036 RepID=A0A849KYW3_9RHOB|nr:DUF1150 family protein [Halovulum dunhuangense]NNU79536.1 DUF1150 family protein [Halovulum dunhuangense]
MGNHPFFKPGEESQIVYVRKVERDALPPEIKDQTRGMDEIYTISDTEGHMLALIDDRQKAFVVARMHEKHPVSVH